MGMVVSVGAQVDVNRALFERNRDFCIGAADTGTILNLTDVVIRDTQSSESDGTFGRGLEVQGGAQVEVTRCSRALFERNRNSGIAAFHTGTILSLTDVVIRNTQSQESYEMFGWGLYVEEGAQVEVNRALFEQNREVGILAADTGTILNLTDVVIRDTQPQESDRRGGRGMQVSDGAQVEVTRALFEQNREAGILAASTGTVLNLTNVVIRNTQSQESDGMYGRGLHIKKGAQVEVTRSLFERNHEVGIGAADTGTILNITDVVIRDTQPQESDRMYGRGLVVSEGAQVDVNQAIFDYNREICIAAGYSSTILNLTDVVIRDTQPQESDGMYGRGLEVSEGAQVEMNRALFDRNHDTGILAGHTGTILSLNDAVIRDTQPRESDKMYGEGLGALEGAQVEVIRVLFERNRNIGIVAAGNGTILNLTDAVISDTQSRESDGMSGRGLSILKGAQVEVIRALFDRNRDFGIGAAHAGTILNLTDAIIRDTQSQESNGIFGRGLNVQEGAKVEVIRALFERNREYGIAAGHAGTDLKLYDVVVTETLERECAQTTCADHGAGTGIGSYGGALVEMERFVVSKNALCGLQLAHGAFINDEGILIIYEQGGTIDLFDGLVSQSPIGVNIQTEEFDIYRLMDKVLYIDNDINLDTRNLPVPQTDIVIQEPPEL